MTDHLKLLRLLKCIGLLSQNTGQTISQLSRSLEISPRTVYRYITVLEECGFLIDKDFHKRYFIHQPASQEYRPAFTEEEVHHLRQVAGLNRSNPIMDSILTKIFEQSALPPMQDMIVRARLLNIVENIRICIDSGNQAIIHHYHSANSAHIQDRLVEPIKINENYSTLIAYEPESGITKFFKLDRMAKVTVMEQKQKFKNKHQQVEGDLFGMGGSQVIWISMELSLRAYNLLREEYPGSIDYLVKEEGRFLFHGPVRGMEGIGRFILGLPGEVGKVNNKDLLEYLRIKRENDTWSGN